MRNAELLEQQRQVRIPKSAFRIASSSNAASQSGARHELLALGLILVAVLVIAGPGITQGGLGWSDAPNHVFDGVFILECFKNWPIANVREWAEQFYLRYPTLGIIVYYPPGFAAAEAIVFAILGVNIFAARFTVLLFALGAGWLMYALGKRWFDRPTGLFAALLLITCPHGFLWMNDVMLEWPATFWILAAVYAFERARETPRVGWSYALGISLVMAYMTKQTAGFILPVLLLYAFVRISGEGPRLHRFPRWETMAAFAVSTAIILAYHLFAREYAALPEQLLRPSADPLFYPRHLPEIVGWPALPIVVLGLLAFVRRPTRGPRGLLLLWLCAWVGFCSAITAKEPRYLFFALPPMMFASARFLIDSDGRRLAWATDRPRLLLLGAVVVAQAGLARWTDTGRLPQYDGAVAELAKRADADLVMVDAVREGQFIFDLYQNETAKTHIIPLRGSKLLYARPSQSRWGIRVFVKNRRDVVDLLDRYGIRYIVVESVVLRTDETGADGPPREWLREVLRRDPRFKLVRWWPLHCGDPVWNGVALELYAYPSCPQRKSKTITLSFPAMGRDLSFDLP